jgi:hypothetical protein
MGLCNTYISMPTCMCTYILTYTHTRRVFACTPCSKALWCYISRTCMRCMRALYIHANLHMHIHTNIHAYTQSICMHALFTTLWCYISRTCMQCMRSLRKIQFICMPTYICTYILTYTHTCRVFACTRYSRRCGVFQRLIRARQLQASARWGRMSCRHLHPSRK